MLAPLLTLVPGLVLGAAAAGITHAALRRRGVARYDKVLATLAGTAAALAWTLFAFDWFLYSISENGPTYYAFSDYLQYRRALSGFVGIAIGVGYAALAGSLACAAAVVLRRVGPLLALVLGLAALGSVALPVAVPAALPRAEYGKVPVFHISRGAYVEAESGQPAVCFFYGIEHPDAGPPTGRSQPELCLFFRPNAAARGLVEPPSPESSGAPSVFDVADYLNEAEVRPYDRVNHVDVDGLELTRSEWPNGPTPPSATKPEPPLIGRLVDDARTRSNVVRMARYMAGCRRREGSYLPCIDPYRLHAARVRLGEGLGNVAVLGVSGNGFSLVGNSSEDHTFRLVRLGRTELRTCTPRGLGGCSGAGRW
jgi:hypothetical protein